MRTGENFKNLTELEKKAGQKAAKNIGRKFKSLVRKIHYPDGLDGVKNTGVMLRKTGARAVMKYDALEAIALSTTAATMINNFGFETIRGNRAVVLKPTSLIDELHKQIKPDVEKLADEIGDIRAEEVTSKLNF